MNILLTNQNIKLIKKVRREDHIFSTRLPYANKKIREVFYSMVNTTYNSTEDMINKLQSLKGETKLEFYQNIINYYNEMTCKRRSNTFQFDEDRFAKNAQGIGNISHEVILLMKFLQTKPQFKNMNINYYDMY